MYTILIAEDDPIGRETLVEAFEDRNYKVLAAIDGEDAKMKLQTEEIDLLITDYIMPRIDGMKLLEFAASICPVILITAHGTVDNAVESMKLGAFDFVTKPVHLPHLFALTERALQMKSLKSENANLVQRVESAFDFSNMVGRSASMKTVFQQIKQAAPTDTTICIQGESGTGKELIANAIHQHSRRSTKPFVKVNCAAIAETLLESELFGHEKGSFTGAIKQQIGRFERANGGSILLDEISEMSPALQAKLLRVLQEKQLERVGGTETISVDIRVIAATNADLKERIKEGTFREDLYYRISVFPINVPPLRERKDDIPLLIDHFLRLHSKNMNKNINGICGESLDALVNYNWPGNIRQLQNAVERACVMVPEGKTVANEHLPPELFQSEFNKKEEDYFPDATMDEIEKMAIERALIKHGGNKSKAAAALKIGLKTLYRKIEKYEI